MSRVNGVYSLPAGSTFTANTVIQSSKMNAITADLEADLNTARPIIAGGTGATSASAARTALGVASPLDDMSGLVTVPANKSYTVRLKAAVGGTISETTTKSASGTCTATFKINTTALGGTANAVSSTEQSQTHSSANVFVAGDDIVVTISSNSSCLDLAFSIKYTKATS